MSSTSSTESKKSRRNGRKEKWIAVKKSKEDTSAAVPVTEPQEDAQHEDTSAVDALVDAATKATAAPAETIV